MKKQKFYIKSNKGIILPMVIIIGLVIGIVAITSYKYMGQHTKLNYHMKNRTQAFYGAKSGIEYAMFRLRNIGDTAMATGMEGFTFSGSEGNRTYEKVFNVEDPFGVNNSASVARGNVKVTIKEDGTTDDGIRMRYKVTSKVIYKE